MTLLPLPLLATGDGWVSPTYLDGSGEMLKTAPEFFWPQEIQRLAQKYKDKDAPPPPKAAPYGGDFYENPRVALERAKSYLVAEDRDDFADALKSGHLKPANPDAAKSNDAARAAINAPRIQEQKAEAKAFEAPKPDGEAEAKPVAPVAPPAIVLPAESDSEFADYHKGAALKLEDEAAAAAWQKLLARPKEERHYRSVWAAYMLGRRALALKDWPAAAQRFTECRALAKEGFVDSAHLAADSYGWQGRAELMQAHYPQAARLYLTQLALGDESAVVSLKRVIPEVASLYSSGPPGGVPGVEPDYNDPNAPAPTEGPAEDESAVQKRWSEAAKDPVLQELVTAHVLATDTASYSEHARVKKWLEIIQKAGVRDVPDAASLAWVAYTAGDYKAAKGWLAKADATAPLSRWMEAKFALRDGKLDAAGKIMPAVVANFPAAQKLPYSTPPEDRANGEAGALLYAQGEFTAAFDTFLKGHCDEDVKFMVESILTTDEVLAIAAKLPAPKPRAKPTDAAKEEEPASPSEDDWRLEATRSIMGRRLVRDGKVKEGRPLLTEEESKVMDEYIAFAVKAEDKNIPKEERAKAGWEAAVLMLERGHEFRGTEEDFHRPNADNGAFTIRPQRLAGVFAPQSFTDEPDAKKPGKVPVFVPVTEQEKKRLAATAKHHAKPMRTRMVAAGHLQTAANLLPDKSEIKARVLNTAGYWLQDIDNAAADKIFSRLGKDFAATPTGQAVIKKRWFTGETNPWSKPGDDAKEDEK